MADFIARSPLCHNTIARSAKVDIIDLEKYLVAQNILFANTPVICQSSETYDHELDPMVLVVLAALALVIILVVLVVCAVVAFR